MQQHVEQVIAEWLKAADDEVNFIGQHTQRTIGAMRSGVNKWRAPKVVVEKLIPWLSRVHHIGVAQNRSPVNIEKEKK